LSVVDQMEGKPVGGIDKSKGVEPSHGGGGGGGGGGRHAGRAKGGGGGRKKMNRDFGFPIRGFSHARKGKGGEILEQKKK